ncbi:hypothetical protein SCUCBS95973_001603 [Sporothrix curviconia]|uniref:Glycoside hydrolase family 31 protein n=1 Tax=Sporothrix curviconia TaxID=1260050 RepID=A0ABP0B024_9PEZI
MARECLLAAAMNLPSSVALSAVFLLAASTASAFVPPSTSGSSFLGASTSQDGVLSLLFSSSAHGQSRNGLVMSNTLSSHGSKPLRQASSSSRASRSRLQTKGSFEAQDHSQVQWNADIPGVVTVQANFSSQAEPGSKGISFAFEGTPHFYGVWEYPWNKAITNNHYGANVTASTAAGRSQSQPVSDIGIYGTQPGINWSNARAPFFFSDMGLGVYIDSDRPVSFAFAEGEGSTNATIGVNAAAITYQILYNQTSIKALLGTFAQLSSYPLLPTESGYGPIFWSDDFEQDFRDSSIKNAQDNINDVANHLDELKIRATSFFADRPYGSGNWSYGNFDFDRKFYPGPAAFIANLAQRGYDFQVWVANRAFLYTQLFNDSSANHWLYPGIDPVQFLGPALNLSIPAAYDYYRTKLVDFVSRMGIHGFKIDRGEEREMPDSEQNKQQNLFLALCDEVMQKAWGTQTQASRGGSYYNFARSAFDRDRSRVGIWNGDSGATFEGLQYTVASAIRAGLLGFSHWGSDTGGYVRDAGGPSEELFARWMHFSAWSPMYEIMIGLNHTPWYQYSPRLVDVLRQTADTHTRLVPYLRTYAHEASTSGVPLVRALFLDFPEDKDAYVTGDAYMLGGDFLIAPVLAEGGNRTVRFPSTSSETTNRRKFLEHENKTLVFAPGDTHSIVQLPLESTPVYVREGSLVPTGDVYPGNSVAWPRKNSCTAWKPHVVLEAFPSFDVPETVVHYYRGREAVAPAGLTPGTVAILMTTDRANRTVTFRAAGSLGAKTSVVVYQKSATNGTTFSTTLDFSNHNETLVATGVYSLFE